MDHNLVAQVLQAAQHSELLRAVLSVRQDGGCAFALGEQIPRPLTSAEITQLEQQGNTAEDWERIRVVEGFDPRRVRNSHFYGEVTLGRFLGTVRVGGVDLPAGIFNSTLAGCVVGHNSLVREVRLLANHVLGEGVVLLDCGQIACEGATNFGNGTPLPIGPETGCRVVRGFAEIDVRTATLLTRLGRDVDLRRAYENALEDYLSQATCARGIVAHGAQIQATPRVQNTYVGPHARITGAMLVAESTLLSSQAEPTEVSTGAVVRSSVLQWGSRITSLAVVERSILTEHSHVERHAKVTDCILGPNSAVGGGEATSSLLGPFVNCHHQSLLIATVWPEGKGNVAYGANVGSNHTSRVPDQECWAGEGMFFGLGVNVKFPCDFTRAPYTVVASGASLLPQRCVFPFSLIATPSNHHPEVSSAFMEIFPGWMLGENLYALWRNEAKFRARNKARRSAIDFAVFRPETVDFMVAACQRLQSISLIKEVYTEDDIDGLGKNFLLEANRRRALEWYRFFIRYYALCGLMDRAQQLVAKGEVGCALRLLTARSEEGCWEHQRRILVDQLGVVDVGAGLSELYSLQERIALAVEESRARDDRRGTRILDDYAEMHPPATQDEWVQKTWSAVRQRQTELLELHAHWRHLTGVAQDVGLVAGVMDFHGPIVA